MQYMGWKKSIACQPVLTLTINGLALGGRPAAVPPECGPAGATGLAQCTELVQQLRGTADKRQVPEARLALQHNLGLGGACVVTLYEKA